MEELARRPKPIHLHPDGRDPCSDAAKLDILWSSPAGPVPIELKYVAARKSDVYGYAFLKDLHRLERITEAGRHSPVSERRFAIFATTESVYWRGGRPEPEPFWLTDGSKRKRREWIQYDQPAAHTRWYGYPPFYLANEYEFAWRDIGRSGRYLLVEVSQQR
jgi:hypothetical protein